MPDDNQDAAPSVFEVPLEGDSIVKIEDWEGPASEVRKNWISNASLQEMREADKQELAKQVAQQVEAEKTRLAAEYQQRMYQQPQAPQQPQYAQQPQQPQPLMARLQQAAQQLRGQNSGFIHADGLFPLLEELVQSVTTELASRDRMFGAVGNKLDEWHTDYQGKTQVLDTVAEAHTSREWSKFVDGLEKEHPELPRSTLELMASGYEAEKGETPEQFRASVAKLVSEQVAGINAHKAQARAKEREMSDAAAAAGLPGVGGAATPSKPDKPLRTADEITEHFAQFDEPAS